MLVFNLSIHKFFIEYVFFFLDLFTMGGSFLRFSDLANLLIMFFWRLSVIPAL